MEEKLRKYAETKELIKGLNEKLDELKPEIEEYMRQEDAEKIDTSFGLFVLKARRTYEYPQELQEREAKLKEDKLKAEQVGTANYQEKNYLQYVTKKGNTTGS